MGRLKPLRVLLTASGAPGAARLIRSLRENGERELRVIGTDMSRRSGGRFLCDGFHTVPRGSSEEFAPALAEIAEREGVDVVFPQSSGEVEQLSTQTSLFAMPVMVASHSAIAACDDKGVTHSLAERIGVRCPQTFTVRTPDEFRAAADELGYPELPICMKPPVSKGSRGFRVLSANVDRRHALLEARPGPLPLSVDDALDAIGETDFPELLVMQLATGKEHTVDGICRGGRMLVGHAKTREAMRAGLAMYFETCHQPELEAAAHKLCAELELDWFVNVQFIGEHLLEINPRISTIVYQDNLNLPYLAVCHAVGEIDEEELASYQTRVSTKRSEIRFYDQFEYYD